MSAASVVGASPQLSSVLSQFESLVQERPDALAVVFEQRELTFAQLDTLANQFAHALRQNDVQPGQHVGLCLDRCPEAIAAMWAIFKVGAAFVPLDPEYPRDRILYMIEDAEISVILTHQRAENSLARTLDSSPGLRWIDSASDSFSRFDTQWPFPVTVQPTDVAYVMYTSGSTGRPKGVEIEHQALATYCQADMQVYRLQPADRTLQFSTLNFDIAIEEIFPPLLAGSCVVVRPSDRAEHANELSAIIERYNVTAVHLATAYWHEWVDLMLATQASVPASLRLVIATGEKVSVEHYRRWLSLCGHDVLWCNAYGPTEATVSATVFIPDEHYAGDNMPIGEPLPGYEAFILDDQHRPVPSGETGQLWLAGDALARGYLNRPDLTEQAFANVRLPDTQCTRRMYATGDLARWLPEGVIEFAGRIDHQIKLGSYRIEPGEIEAVIHRHHGVCESLVTYDAVAGQKYLIAYVATGDHPTTIEQLSEFLRAELPNYMVPSRYVLMKSFPKTINGKIDRAGLPGPAESCTPRSDNYQAPRSELETYLADLWQTVLNVPRVGIEDDFFELGGSSLLVTRVVAELTKKLGVELPVRDFFANPTVVSSARHLAELTGQPVLDQAEVATAARLSRARQPRLQPGFITQGDRQLFHVHYAPPETGQFESDTDRLAVLMCHSLGHEYTRAYRNLQQLALMLARRGHHVLRFDYSGTGNSSGDCADGRLESLQSDTRKAAEHLLGCSGAMRYAVVGIRLGATVAATTPFEQPPERCVLWDPVVDGQAFLNTLWQLHDYALSSQTRFARVIQDSEPNQVFGHATSPEQLSSLAKLQLPQDLSPASLLLTSAGYTDEETGFRVSAGSRQRSVADEIYWHRQEFTESAFSSPDAFREIQDFLDHPGDRNGVSCTDVPFHA